MQRTIKLHFINFLKLHEYMCWCVLDAHLKYRDLKVYDAERIWCFNSRCKIHTKTHNLNSYFTNMLCTGYSHVATNADLLQKWLSYHLPIQHRSVWRIKGAVILSLTVTRETATIAGGTLVQQSHVLFWHALSLWRGGSWGAVASNCLGSNAAAFSEL